MSESQRTVTRREILKRGAIVGGGVLWVTPVVQTLGMGPAFAKPVSGDTCKMTLELVSCTRQTATSTNFFLNMRACMPPGCACNPLPNNRGVEFIMSRPDGSFVESWTEVTVDANGCATATMLQTPPLDLYALCTEGSSTDGTRRVLAESNHITVTADDLASCPVHTY